MAGGGGAGADAAPEKAFTLAADGAISFVFFSRADRLSLIIYANRCSSIRAFFQAPVLGGSKPAVKMSEENIGRMLVDGRQPMKN